MRNTTIKAFLIVFLFTVWIFPNTAPSFEKDRYFDYADLQSDKIRLAVSYPIILNIKRLVELRKRGFIPSEGLIIIGVFHGDEVYDYTESIEFVEDHNIDWMKFHKVSGEIDYDTAFKKNALTEEFEKIFRHSNGIIFFGGDDIPPRLYNKKTHLLTDIETPARHLFELSFIFHLLGGSQDKGFVPLLESHPLYPVFGICLGCQSLNVGTGGTLVQDIWSEIYGKEYVEDAITIPRELLHRNPHDKLYAKDVLPFGNMHPIRLVENLRLMTATGLSVQETPYVLSRHHQAVGELGKGWIISATSMDGKVIEAIEHKKYPNVFGVQFHPENQLLWDKGLKNRFSPDSEETSYRQVLEDNPPSFEFHKKLWSWFCTQLSEAKAKRDEPSR